MNFPCLKITFAGETKYVPLSEGTAYGLTPNEVEAMAQGRISSREGHMEGLWVYAYTALDAKRDAASSLYDAAKQFLRVHGNCGSPAQQEAAKELEAAIALAEGR